MKQITDIFQNMSGLAQYAPVTDTNIALGDLKAAFASSWKQLTALIPDTVLTAIADGSDDAMKDALRMALANRIMANNAVFSAYTNRKAGTDTYKYEVEGMKRSWMENYFSAMDTLLSELTRQADEVAPADENVASAEPGTEVAPAEPGTEEVAAADNGTTPDIGQLFRESRFYRMAAGCHIRTAEQFDTIYPIDLSYLFFFRTLPLQAEVVSGRIGSYYSRIETLDDKDQFTGMLDLALAKKTVAKALRRFDILEFPPTIRNLFDESHANRNGKDEAERAISLADMLDGEADALISDIDTLLESGTTIDMSSMSAYNRPDDKIIMMP
jgi:hypothetical protein